MSDVINDVPVDAPADPVPADVDPVTPVQAANNDTLQKLADGVLTPTDALAAAPNLSTELQTMRMARQRDLHALNRGSQCELDLIAVRAELQLYKDREQSVQVLLDTVDADRDAPADLVAAADAVRDFVVTP